MKLKTMGLTLILMLLMVSAASAQEATPTPTPLDPPAATEAPLITTVGPDAPVSEGGLIEFGASMTGDLSGGGADEYQFEGEAGQMITITMTSDAFDSYLTLRDPNGVELRTDDDSAGSLNSRIGPFSLPVNGIYSFTASSYNGSGEGAYTVALGSSTAQLIEYTQSIEGTLTVASTSGLYRFRGQQGDSVLISMNSTDFDSYLALAQMDGGPGYDLITNDDGGGNLNALIGPFVLPATGDYLITARSLSGTDVGSFTLRLNRAEFTDITFGETITSELDAGTQAGYFRFEGRAGDVIDVSVDGGDIDTTLVLNGPDGYQVAYDDDGGSGFNPELTSISLTQDGDYVLLVTPYSSNAEGEFELTVNRAELLSLDDGTVEITLGDKRTDAVVTFTGTAGESIRLTMSAPGSTGSPSLNITQDGLTLAYGSATTVSGFSIEFVVTSDGSVTVQLSDYSYAGNVDWSLSLERLSAE